MTPIFKQQRLLKAEGFLKIFTLNACMSVQCTEDGTEDLNTLLITRNKHTPSRL